MSISSHGAHGGSGRYPAAVQYSRSSPHFAEYEHLRVSLEEVNAKIDSEARSHINSLHLLIKEQQHAREQFDANVASLKAELAQYEVSESAVSLTEQVSITTTQEASQSYMSSKMMEMRKMHRENLNKLENELDRVQMDNKTEARQLDEEIVHLNNELDEVQEKFETETAELVANIAAHKRTVEKIKVTITERKQESTEKVQKETELRLKAVRSVYWDHFRSMKDELQRANHMTLTLETRYKELSKLFVDLLKDHTESLWTEGVVNNRVHFEQNAADFTTTLSLSGKQNERLMKQRLDAEVERCCAFHLSHPTEKVEVTSTSNYHLTSTPSKKGED